MGPATNPVATPGDYAREAAGAETGRRILFFQALLCREFRPLWGVVCQGPLLFHSDLTELTRWASDLLVTLVANA